MPYTVTEIPVVPFLRDLRNIDETNTSHLNDKQILTFIKTFREKADLMEKVLKKNNDCEVINSCQVSCKNCRTSLHFSVS